MWKLRRVLSGLDGQQALELLLERLKKSQTNIEFLHAGPEDDADAGQPRGLRPATTSVARAAERAARLPVRTPRR